MGKKYFFQLFEQYCDTNIQDNVISHTLGADIEAVKKLYDEYIHESIDDENEKNKNKTITDTSRPSFIRQRKNKVKKENPLEKVKTRDKTNTVELFAFLFLSEMEVINLVNKRLRYIDVQYISNAFHHVKNVTQIQNVINVEMILNMVIIVMNVHLMILVFIFLLKHQENIMTLLHVLMIFTHITKQKRKQKKENLNWKKKRMKQIKMKQRKVVDCNFTNIRLGHASEVV